MLYSKYGETMTTMRNQTADYAQRQGRFDHGATKMGYRARSGQRLIIYGIRKACPQSLREGYNLGQQVANSYVSERYLHTLASKPFGPKERELSTTTVLREQPLFRTG